MFNYETPFLDLEVYRLVAILEASHRLAEFEGSESDKRQLEFLRHWEFPEVSRIVVSLAAIIRSALDASPRYYDVVQKPAIERWVGTLIPDESKPHWKKPLRFREACNKVLHADKVDLEVDPSTGALTGRLILVGQLNKKEWCAELDLREYALSALVLTP